MDKRKPEESPLVPRGKMSNSTNTNTQKSPLREINPVLAGVKPPSQVIELVDACVSLYGYQRSEIKNAFLRALSLPELSIYTDVDERCEIAIDIVTNKLGARFSSKEKLQYPWKNASDKLVLSGLDKYGHGLFPDPWTPEPKESNPESAVFLSPVAEISVVWRRYKY